MKAFIYNGIFNGQNFICSAFENHKEFVNIFHNPQGIYHQYCQQGAVHYSTRTGNVENAIRQFQAQNIQQSKNDVGKIVKHVWRPGLCIDIPKALEINSSEKTRAQRELRILIERLGDILLYIEPSSQSLQSFGHKIRELLILTCTAIESIWQSYLRLAGNLPDRPTTRDYVKLKDKLFLHEYKITFISHPFEEEYKPFGDWDLNRPTISLDWYVAYNQTKHDSQANFDKATLNHCIKSLTAMITLFCARYSPYEILNGEDICSKLVNEYFTIELDTPSIASFYVPRFESWETATGAFSAPLASRLSPWQITPFTLSKF